VSDGRLDGHRAIWQSKPVLRAIYEDLYRRIVGACVPGRTLEIGGGTGNLKAFAPDVVSSDIQVAPWLDIACDAHRLPFAPAAFSNVVLFDVLHHLARPRLFFEEAQRVLKSNGRIVLVEPAMTFASLPFYHWLHEEPVRLGEDPLEKGDPPKGRNPYDANQAIPSLLFGPVFGRHRHRFEAAFPSLLIREVRPTSLFAYPLSGGFRRWSLVPESLVGTLLRAEAVLAPLLGPILAFRLVVVLERA
jgi:SAM-dependent methyltransferase